MPTACGTEVLTAGCPGLGLVVVIVILPFSATMSTTGVGATALANKNKRRMLSSCEIAEGEPNGAPVEMKRYTQEGEVTATDGGPISTCPGPHLFRNF